MFRQRRKRNVGRITGRNREGKTSGIELNAHGSPVDAKNRTDISSVEESLEELDIEDDN